VYDVVHVCGGTRSNQSLIKNFRTNDKCPVAIRDILRSLPVEEANADYFGPDAMAVALCYINPLLDSDTIKSAVRATPAFTVHAAKEGLTNDDDLKGTTQKVTTQIATTVADKSAIYNEIRLGMVHPKPRLNTTIYI
jgi:hypothetical protein